MDTSIRGCFMELKNENLQRQKGSFQLDREIPGRNQWSRISYLIFPLLQDRTWQIQCFLWSNVPVATKIEAIDNDKTFHPTLIKYTVVCNQSRVSGSIYPSQELTFRYTNVSLGWSWISREAWYNTGCLVKMSPLHDFHLSHLWNLNMKIASMTTSVLRNWYKMEYDFCGQNGNCSLVKAVRGPFQGENLPISEFFIIKEYRS